jgi:hypothetical protein
MRLISKKIKASSVTAVGCATFSKGEGYNVVQIMPPAAAEEMFRATLNMAVWRDGARGLFNCNINS